MANDKLPSWLKRAFDPSTPMTDDNETMRTIDVEIDGKMYLVPTIRMGEDGKLYKLKDKEAIKKAKADAATGEFRCFPNEAFIAAKIGIPIPAKSMIEAYDSIFPPAVIFVFFFIIFIKRGNNRSINAFNLHLIL